MKKLRSLIAFIPIIVVFGFVINSLVQSNTVSYDEIWIDTATINTVVNADGSIDVKETWAVDVATGDQYRNVYKQIGTYYENFNAYSRLDVHSVTYDNKSLALEFDPDVYDLDNKDLPSNSNIYYVDETNKKVGTEIGVVMPYLSEGIHTFTFNYTISDFVGGYNDMAELYYKMFSDKFTLPIKHFNATITMPELTTNADPYMGYFHCTVTDSNLSIDKNVITATANDIKEGTQIEIRSVMDNSLFGYLSNNQNIDNKQTVLDQEQKWADDYAKEIQRAVVMTWVDIIAGVALIVIATLYSIYIKIRSKRLLGDYPEYYRDIPAGWTVGQLAHIFYYYETNEKKVQSKVMSASVLDLARKGYLSIEEDRNTGDCGITVVSDLSAVKIAELKESEKSLYDLMWEVQEIYGTSFTMEHFEKHCEINTYEVNKQLVKFWNTSKRRLGKANLIDKASEKFKKQSGLVIIGFVLITVLSFFLMLFGVANGMFGCAGAFISVIIVAICAPKKARLNEAGEAKFAELKGLERYMKDFSNLKEYDVPQLILWEEYLVLATMMGISKEVLDSLKMVYVDMENPEISGGLYTGYNRNTFMHTYMFMSMRNSSGFSGGMDLGKGFERSFNNMNTAIAHNLKSSGGGSDGGGFGGGGFGGGGFSGGGGGFGGGGGGAR